MATTSMPALLALTLTLGSATACQPGDDGPGGLTPRAWAQMHPIQQSEHLATLSERALQSVVHITATRMAPARGMDPMWGPFFGPDPRRQAPSQGLGSGVIVTADGVVLTNHHVIEGAADIRVQTHDGRTFEAELVGSDQATDLAVLRLRDATSLAALPFADSDGVRPGQLVLAIGNPFGLSGSVSMGIVSAVGRTRMGITDYEDFIQTDAAINPGNSGGALVNMQGELIGINTAILSRNGGYQGVGFAIPARMASHVLERLVRDGRVVRGWLGVGIQDLTPELARGLGTDVGAGVVLSDVQPGSPAAAAGLQRGDVVTHIDGQPVSGADALRHRVALLDPGREVRITGQREGRPLQRSVAIGERPDARDAAAPAPGDPGGAGIGAGVRALTSAERQQLGLVQESAGVLVERVEPQSLAGRLGLRPGDVILEANRQPVGSPEALAQALTARPGEVLLLVRRGSSTVYLYGSGR
jgi:serine protease Do